MLSCARATSFGRSGYPPRSRTSPARGRGKGGVAGMPAWLARRLDNFGWEVPRRQIMRWPRTAAGVLGLVAMLALSSSSTPPPASAQTDDALKALREDVQMLK